METAKYVIDLILEHWALVFSSALLWSVSNAFKTVAPPASTSKAWSWAWRLLPIQPLVLGLLLGSIPKSPLPESLNSLGAVARLLYYGGAGVLATYAHDIFITAKKYKLVLNKDGS